MRLLIMGPPGAGKGTQGKTIANHFGIPAISTGEIFRDNVERQTELGRIVQELIENGDFVPDDITERIVEERLGRPDAARGYLLDGFPRTVHQVKALDAILKRSGTFLDVVLSLTVDVEQVVARLLARAELEGRADDTDETIRHRQNVYIEETEPLLAIYRERGILLEIDGEGSIDEVGDRIIEAVDAWVSV